MWHTLKIKQNNKTMFGIKEQDPVITGELAEMLYNDYKSAFGEHALLSKKKQ